MKHSGCSAVRLAHLLWEQGVVGSNPATPTSFRISCCFSSNFFVYTSSSLYTKLITEPETVILTSNAFHFR